MEPAGDLEREDVPRPAVLDGARCVPKARGFVVELLRQLHYGLLTARLDCEGAVTHR
jgi:hypothetical protein